MHNSLADRNFDVAVYFGRWYHHFRERRERHRSSGLASPAGHGRHTVGAISEVYHVNNMVPGSAFPHFNVWVPSQGWADVRLLRSRYRRTNLRVVDGNQQVCLEGWRPLPCGFGTEGLLGANYGGFAVCLRLV